MATLKSYMDQHLPKRIILAIAFAIAFVVIPAVLTDFYFHYIDNTKYIMITQPVSVDQKEYKPCDPVLITTTLTAKIDVNIHSLTQLVLIKDDSSTTRVGEVIPGDIPIRALDPHIISGTIYLPCKLDDGRYFWQGNGTYLVHGYERTFSFTSDTFNVWQTGLSPETLQEIKNATESAQQQK